MSPDISVASWFAKRASRTPHRRALTFEGATATFAEVWARAERLAGGLRAGGVRAGDRVAFLGLNHPSFFETLLAAGQLGAIFVPLNFRLSPAELSYIIGDAGVHTLVADSTCQSGIDTVRTDLTVQRYVASDGTGDGWEPYEVLVGADRVTDKVPVAEDDVALIMYTSGTTGRPKGAMLTHGNLWWNNVNALHSFDVLSDDVTLTVAPLFHIGGLNVITLITWQKGGEVVLHRAFDPGSVLADIPRYGVTTFFGVPAMFLFASQHPGFDAADLSSIRLFICGGAPVPEPLLRLYLDRGVPIQQGYGLTETAPAVTVLAPEHGLARLGSAGTPPLFTEVRIADAENVTVTEIEGRGEVCARGPNVLLGYWNNPEATTAAIDADGWFHTGDVGYLDADGFLFIADRVKDMVITGGENVYPAEVESVLFAHPSIAEVAVIGLPDERWGEAVVAVVVPSGETPTLADLREFGGASLARYKLPTRLHLIDALPRNPAGKVLKFELRDRFLDETP
jgi:fatty-acyl-CoA synthase